MYLRSLSVVTLLAATGITLFGCEPGTAEFPPAVRDSAGITIVENSDRGETDQNGIRVDPNPVLTIGAVKGDWQYQLLGVQGALRLSDGRIAIANGGTEEIRIFDSKGSILRVFGGEGEGPGEFRGLAFAGVLPGDTLVAIGRRDRRISLIDSEAGFVSSIPTDFLPEGGLLQAFGLFSDRRIMLRAGSSLSAGGRGPGPVRMDQRYFSATLSGTDLEEYPTLPGPESYVGATSAYVSITVLPFGKSPGVAVAPNRVFMGTGETYEILAFTPGGVLERVIRVRQSSVPLTGKDIDRYVEMAVANARDGDAAPRIRRTLEEVPWPETLPPYLRFLADPEGCLWVEESRLPGEDVPVWTVFGADGTRLGRLSMPLGVELLEIGEDYILGLWRDDLGVEYVKMYALTR
jgi:hypothetical protein